MQEYKAAASLLIPLALFTSLLMPSAAIAATAPSEGATVAIGSSEGTQAEANNKRLGYSLGEGNPDSPAVDLTPISGEYSFVTAGFVPAFVAQSETNSRAFTFTNTSSQAFTVENIAAAISPSGYEGGDHTHQVIEAGTSVLAAQQTGVEVPAGASIPVSFETVDPFAAAIRTNSAGEITGVGTTTQITFKVNGKAYGFEENIGIGTAAPTNVFSDVQEEPLALFPTCDGDGTNQPQLTLCHTMASASVSMTALFMDEQNSNPVGAGSVTGRVVNGDGSAMPDVTVIISTPVPTSTVTDNEGSYTFHNLPEGSYQVGVTTPSGYEVVSTPNPFNLGTTTVSLKDTVLSLPTGVPSEANSSENRGDATDTDDNAVLFVSLSIAIFVFLIYAAVACVVLFKLREAEKKKDEKRAAKPFTVSTEQHRTLLADQDRTES